MHLEKLVNIFLQHIFIYFIFIIFLHKRKILKSYKKSATEERVNRNLRVKKTKQYTILPTK